MSKFELPKGYRLMYLPSVGRLRAICYRIADDKMKYGAAIYKDDDYFADNTGDSDTESLDEDLAQDKDLRAKLRRTAVARVQKCPVVVDVPAEYFSKWTPSQRRKFMRHNLAVHGCRDSTKI